MLTKTLVKVDAEVDVQAQAVGLPPRNVAVVDNNASLF